jgi:hypothetical protein
MRFDVLTHRLSDGTGPIVDVLILPDRVELRKDRLEEFKLVRILGIGVGGR